MKRSSQVPCRGYETLEPGEHFKDGDYATFDLLNNDVLPHLNDDQTHQFALLVFNIDTHAPCGYSPKCRDHLPLRYPRAYRAFTCLDDSLRDFYERLRKTDSVNNTELVIYGDHLMVPLGFPAARVKFTLPRNLTIFSRFGHRTKRGTGELGKHCRILISHRQF
jgi:hypothetical protein